MKRLAFASSAILVLGLGPASAETIVAAPGDSLSRIAARYLGDAGRWPELCEANSATLDGDCDMLPVGTQIEVPAAAPVAAEPAAPEPTAAEPAATPEPAAAEPVPAAAPEPAPAAEPAPAPAPAGDLTDLVVRQISFENLTIASGEEFAGQRSIVLTPMPGAGAGRVAYLIEIEAAARVQVSLALHAPDPDPVTVLLYSGSRGGTYGSIDFDAAAATSTTGAVEDAAVSREGDWLTLSFAFAVGPEQTSSQVLIYPAGLSAAAGTEPPVTVTTPVARGEVAP